MGAQASSMPKDPEKADPEKVSSLQDEKQGGGEVCIDGGTDILTNGNNEKIPTAPIDASHRLDEQVRILEEHDRQSRNTFFQSRMVPAFLIMGYIPLYAFQLSLLTNYWERPGSECVAAPIFIWIYVCFTTYSLGKAWVYAPSERGRVARKMRERLATLLELVIRDEKVPERIASARAVAQPFTELLPPWTPYIDPMAVEGFGLEYNWRVSLLGFAITTFYVFRYLGGFTWMDDMENPGILHSRYQLAIAAMCGLPGARALRLAGLPVLRWLANRGLDEQWKRWKTELPFWVWMAAADTGGLPFEMIAKWLDEDPVAKQQYDNLLDVVEHMQEA
ncbi:hypothetical protein, variant [Cryptococcus amylolentus CBS 6039]|uniref:Uncharacterized protein n=1 Tax=Cryptococcus amylolentus CBS 6039 TaxID=1295533 RepID=A0A1E3HBI8_9TREE|nr:hypothetical protein, variant [Cryptococcus amylolentus CBS 6039]ODN73702.1 hypothetical protein, variant [Cryptococcus amylolentus CBS 6039]